MYLTARRESPTWFKNAIRVAFIMLLIEWGWVGINKASLDHNSIDTELSLMTYNVYFKNRTPMSVVKVIKQSNPDILVIQELTPQWNSILAKSIGQTYKHQKIIPMRGTHGIGIYSRFPIVAEAILNNKSNRAFAQVLEIKIKNKLIQLVNVHLASPGVAVENPDRFLELYKSNYKTRHRQINTISNIVKNSEDKFDAQILIGDLNTTEYEPLLRDVQGAWSNLNELVGEKFNFSFPNSSKIDPILTLDYILLKGKIKGQKITVIKGGSSDHFPILGKVKI
ncbi:MAG: endonuclease/exonuclease/phosphatase (EEP) superfamily protein YafD [Saprospiraceae bacterium]|jgi:endonuclease/exonuclease/phosphatase (EEP) superfamily protein YafD